MFGKTKFSRMVIAVYAIKSQIKICYNLSRYGYDEVMKLFFELLWR
jgi:hypothetical protein